MLHCYGIKNKLVVQNENYKIKYIFLAVVLLVVLTLSIPPLSFNEVEEKNIVNAIQRFERCSMSIGVLPCAIISSLDEGEK